MGNIILKNAKLTNNNITNLIIEEGKIKKITKTLKKSDTTTDKIIDIKENIIIPGLIDTHVHFRDPGFPKKETWKTGSQAAAHGGYTTVIDMPNTNPATNTKKAFQDKKQKAQKNSTVDFALHAGVKTQKDVNEILPLKPASYKIFMDLHTNKQLDEMFKYVAQTKKPLTLHAEDKQIIEHNIKTLKKDPKNKINMTTYSQARSAVAELIAVNRAIELAEKHGNKIHICHLSTNDTLQLIHMAKNKINITTEATPHHLYLDNSTYITYGGKAKTNPPLRDTTHKININQINEFDQIATDHAPHTMEEKTKDTWNTLSGIPNLETTLKLLLTSAHYGTITLDEIIQKTSMKPAEIFNIPNKGKIEEGYDADITVIDMKEEGKIKPDEFYTKGKYTPFENMPYKGNNIMTINRGNIISEYDEVYENKPKYIYE